MQSMNLIGKFISNFREFYNEINAATLTGAIDVVVIELPDGSFTCSPFHVRFGKLGVLRSREKIVDILINDEPLDIHMKLGESGEAFFVEDGEEEEEIPPHLACSPIPSHEYLQKWKEEHEKTEWNDQQEHIAKVFVAETVGNEKSDGRKRSLVVGEFRPIEDSFSEPAEKVDTGDLSSSSLSLNQQSGASKRKRKKKSSVKRKGNNNNNNSHVSEPPYQPETSVFTLDDLDKSPLTDNSTASESLTALPRIPLTGEREYCFSDTELTAGCSPESRPPSPVVSDTEVEQRRHHENEAEAVGMSQSWKWGELPSPLPHSTSLMTGDSSPEAEEAAKKQKQEEAQRSMLSGMFSFMKTKHLRQAQQDGVYLSDIDADDPEVCDLYFPNPYNDAMVAPRTERNREEDAESGNGPSIPNSPVSQSPPTFASDFTSHMKCDFMDVSLSLCGNLETGVSEDLFNQRLVSYDSFVADPMLIDHPELVVRMNGKYYNWRTACSLVMCLALFKRPIPQAVIDIWSSELGPSAKMKGSKDKGKPSGYSSWWAWGRTQQEQSAAGAVKGTKEDLNVEELVTSEKISEEAALKTPVIDDKVEGSNGTDEDTDKKDKGYVPSNSSEESDSGSMKNQNKIPPGRRSYQKSDKCRKTLRLTSEQIKRLNLKEGANEVEFSVTTAYQGTSRCKCHIYKWRFDDKIVISDIDGTITKSDVLGHVLPIVGRDWAQSGVAQLFTKIKNNGYKLLYLSARAIGQARVTRDYLRSIKQGDLGLPDGPLLLNPTSLINAFHREVIEKKPEEFKISCLRDIAALFPPDTKPFYAGYGNRVNDVWAYRAVGIPIVRIFTINPKGEIKHELTKTFQSSYSSMCHLVDQMYPPPRVEGLAEDYSQFVFWRDPLPEIDLSHLSAPAKVDPKK